MGTLQEDQRPFMIVCRWVFLRTRNVLDKSCRENKKTRCMFITPFLENRAVCEIMCKNVVETGRPETTI
jgi:hypothetical protein